MRRFEQNHRGRTQVQKTREETIEIGILHLMLNEALLDVSCRND